jgi:hypothetical protein
LAPSDSKEEIRMQLVTLDGRTIEGEIVGRLDDRGGVTLTVNHETARPSTVGESFMGYEIPKVENVEEPVPEHHWTYFGLSAAIRAKMLELRASQEWCSSGTNAALGVLGMPDRDWDEDAAVQTLISTVHSLVRTRARDGEIRLPEVELALRRLGIPLPPEADHWHTWEIDEFASGGVWLTCVDPGCPADRRLVSGALPIEMPEDDVRRRPMSPNGAASSVVREEDTPEANPNMRQPRTDSAASEPRRTRSGVSAGDA